MTKHHLIHQYFQRKELLTPTNQQYKDQLHRLFEFMISGDQVTQNRSIQELGIKGSGHAQIISKQKGIVAGLEEIMYVCKAFTHVKLNLKVKDGDPVLSGQTLSMISGEYKALLQYERTLLNILGRMSGIATSTYRLASKLGTFPALAATRKTPWMLLDKKSVAVGGGLTHRLNLADWPMIKDNHLNILSTHTQSPFADAITMLIKSNVPFFEIEVETPQHVDIIIETLENLKIKHAAMAILLDNFTPDIARDTISKLQNHAIAQSIITEASGNITKENLAAWATTGVDILSLGSLTHSAPNFDVSMEIL